MSAWKPIETARKDNRSILGWEPILRNIWQVTWSDHDEAFTHTESGRLCYGLTLWQDLPDDPPRITHD